MPTTSIWNSSFSVSITLLALFHYFVGPPSPPCPNVKYPSASLLHLQWMAPFTWPGYDITQYTIALESGHNHPQEIYSLNSTACGKQTVDCCHLIAGNLELGSGRNASVQCSNDTVSFHLESAGGSVGNCTQYLFAIAASNAVGSSNVTTLTVGFPKSKFYSHN